MPAVTRRTLLESLSSVPLLSAALLAASQRADPKQAATTVYELRVYHAAPGKLGELLTRFRQQTTGLFEKHGMKNIAYGTPVDEPESGNTLIYILQHPSREAAAANWKSFQDDPDQSEIWCFPFSLGRSFPRCTKPRCFGGRFHAIIEGRCP
jgi:hypothetical protein